MRFRVYVENAAQFRAAWGRVDQEVVGGARRGVAKGAQAGIAEMLQVRTWKDRTGDTRKKIRTHPSAAPPRGAESIMEVAVDHASYLDTGTKPHIIRPRSLAGKPRAKKKISGKKVGDVGTHRVSLRWYSSGGQPIFAKEVHHPGTSGDNFFTKGVQKCERVMVSEIELGVERAQKILDE